MDEVLSSAPYLHGGDATRLRMADTVIALLPVMAGAVWFFRWRAVALLVLAAAGCLLVEQVSGMFWKRGSLRDCSALVSGLLLGLTLPPGCPWWAALAGGMLSAAFKAVSGGLGRNLLNPAAFARAVLLALPALRPAALRTAQGTFLMAYTGGSLGEVSSLLLLAGAAYLAMRRLLPWAITVPYLIAAFAAGLCIPRCDPLAILCWGGTLLGAAFFSADPVTTPMDVRLRAASGVFSGAACTLAAFYGWGIGGVCCGILLSNGLFRTAEWLLFRRR